jgi:hypothetical protein
MTVPVARLIVASAALTSILATSIFACSSGSTKSATQDGGTEASSEEAAAGDAARDGMPDVVTSDTSISDTSISDAGTSDSRSADADAEAAAPFLTAFTVVPPPGMDGSVAAALVPSFSPGVHDYYVRCAAGTNVLTVSTTASAGANSALTQPITTAPAPTQSISVGVLEGQAIVAVATLGALTTEYWVRCLPHDFPQLEMSAHPEAGTAPPGYYLVGNLLTLVSAGYAMVLDGDGVPVWYYAMPAALGALDVDNVVAGAISFIASSAVMDESFQVHALSPVSTTTIGPTGDVTDTHELRVLPNGDFIVLSYPFKSGVDLTGLSVITGDGGFQPLGPGSTIQDCAVVEFTPSGSVVSTWRASDHFDPAKVSEFPLTGFGPGATLPDGGAVYDVFHCNSVDVDPVNGNLLVSGREMHSIFYVDRATGKVLWKMGGVSSSLDNATYVTVPDPFYFQHDARFQPGWSPGCSGGSGQIALFDDESLMANPARGVVYDVVVGGVDGGAAACDAGPAGDGGDGGTAGLATVAWQYKGLVSSLATGSFRISADGSRVIGWGIGGTPDLAFTEVDINGNDLLDFRFTDGNATYRAIKVPLTAFDLSVLRSTSGAP